MTDTEKEAETFTQLREAISKLASSESPARAGCRQEELRLLYAQKQEWARHYNGLIWSITAILLPVALGGLALTFRNDAGQLQKAALVFSAIGSSMLLIFWNMICDRHRALWQREFKLTHIIEAAWELRPWPTDFHSAGTHLLSTDTGHIKRVRNAIAWIGVITWATRVFVELAV